MKKSQRTIDSKSPLLALTLVSVCAVFSNIQLTVAFKANAELFMFLSVVIAASVLALCKPTGVKGFTSQTIVAQCILVIAMSTLRFLVGELIEPVWTVTCLTLITTLISKAVAETKLIFPTVVEVMAYKATKIE
ncbi:hypothetical protein AB4455_10130 [Vibrio sp. 10N.261.46.E12]|uniref:hypothetical protein n=1 Tax=unclassified Vibrio TaxID=2614977 RepID=UPI0009771AEC|nr:MULTISPECIES: hypothetical protein [unclassified Vibrio]OMO36178.1 hypothetical protein BH584_05220 [Vibrio sp. 10N.261.45.E1]PMJ34470.1 hypothetical protein BCU27_03315 [Vibrio sp. 10N.286.45.B6]PML87998.1 hypothetical protein BCT66_10385 [Vibrio sp. 10N.261.49.E11]PMM67325.1 hypothetical protein BCT48_14855 [Vibrio sp. 10N.261.46.F12]PMM81791.1 hypothetical protein BCT46_15400 [Vibrio sp. 10N.261.46.E8]